MSQQAGSPEVTEETAKEPQTATHVRAGHKVEEERSLEDDIAFLRRFLVERFGSEKGAFRALDINGSGDVSYNEIVSSFKICHISVTEALGGGDLRKVFMELDADGNGDLSVHELLYSTADGRKEKRLKAQEKKEREKMERKMANKGSKDYIAAKRVSTDAADVKAMHQNPKERKTILPSRASVSLDDAVEKFRAFLIGRFGSAKRAFACLDRDSNGDISMVEFKSLTKRAVSDSCHQYGINVSEVTGGVDFDTLFKELDCDGGGELSFFEMFETTAEMRRDPVIIFRRHLIDHFGSDKKAFAAIDYNGNGLLSFFELKDAIDRLGEVGRKATKGVDLRKIFKMMDLDGGGELTFYELFKTSLKERNDPVVKLRRHLVDKYGSQKKAFEALDADRSGELSLPELGNALHKSGVNAIEVTGWDLRRLFKEMDIDKGGELSFNELFKTTWEQRHKAMVSRKAAKKKSDAALFRRQSSLRKSSMKKDIEYVEESSSDEEGVTEADLTRAPKIEAFANDQNMAALDLQKGFIGQSGATLLAFAIRKPGVTRKMKLLQLEANYICSLGVIKLAPAIEKHCTLQKLVLSWNGIGDRGALRLATMAKRMASLQVLDLSNNRIGNEGASFFVTALKKIAGSNHALKTLDLRNNAVGAVELSDLRSVSGRVKVRLEENTGTVRTDFESDNILWATPVSPPIGPTLEKLERRNAQLQAKNKRFEEEQAVLEEERKLAEKMFESRGSLAAAKHGGSYASPESKASVLTPPRTPPSSRAPASEWLADLEEWPPVVQLRKAVSEASLAGFGMSQLRPASQGRLGASNAKSMAASNARKKRKQEPILLHHKFPQVLKVSGPRSSKPSSHSHRTSPSLDPNSLLRDNLDDH